MTVIFMLYSFMGGLLATAWVDVLQGLLIIVLSFLVIPLGWHVVGGLDGMKTTLTADHFSLMIPQGIGPWFITMLTVNGLIGVLAQPHFIAAVATGRDELTCRIGHFFGNFIKRVCTVGWAGVGLIAATMVARGIGSSKLADPELAFGFACRELLFPGGVGLLAASFLAASTAAASAFMVDSGALFTNGLYRKHLVRAAPDQHYLWVGRISGLTITLLAVAYAIFLVDRVLYSFLLAETMAAFVGIAILGGIVWRRANRWGAIAGTLSAMSLNFGLYAAKGQRLDAWDPNTFSIALSVGIVVLVVVSLLTPMEPAEALQAFFRNLETPSEGDDTLSDLADQPAVEQLAAEHGKRLLLLHILRPTGGTNGVGFWRAYRRDLLGFVVGTVLIVALVLLLKVLVAS